MKINMIITLCLAFFVGIEADVAKGAAAAMGFDAKMAEQAKNLNKFMPGPTGPGFKDKGMTKDAEFQQMGRFGIPDLNNPTTIDLTDLNFDTVVAGDKYVGVLFYAPSMTEFEFYALHWEKASMELSENIKSYTSAEIQMTRFDISEPEHLDIAELYGVSRDKPEMLLFYNGTVLAPISSYIGHADIRQFIIAQTIPSVSYLTCDGELKKWKRRKVFNQSNMKYLAYFDPEVNKEELANFKAIASSMKTRVQFAYVTSKELLAAAIGKNVEATESNLYLLRDFDSPRVIPFPSLQTLPFTRESAEDLVNDYNMPLLTNLGDNEEYRVRNFLSHPKHFRLLAFFKTEADKDTAKPHLESLAKEFGQDLLVAFTIEDPEDSMNFDYQFWDVPSDKPAILVVHMRRDRKYLYAGDDAHSMDQMHSFVSNVLDGKVQPKLKSQVPPTPNNGLVRVLGTNTFAKEVHQNLNQDSLVLLTRSDRHQPSQWFVRQLERFAKVWRRENRLLIARMDMNQNDLLELEDSEMKRLPKLLYISQNTKKSGSGSLGVSLDELYPTMEDLMNFVQTQQSVELQVDNKVWNRVLTEDKELLRKHREAQEKNEDIDHPSDILKELEAEIQSLHQPKDEFSLYTPQEGHYQVPEKIGLHGQDVEFCRHSDETEVESVVEELPKVELTHSEKSSDFKGRIRIWPGVLLLIAFVAVAGVLMAYFGIQGRRDMEDRRFKVQMRRYRIHSINGGITTSGSGSGANVKPLVDDDGVVNNPQVYADQGCALPNYVSKNNKIYAVAKNGTQVPLGIKGLNWFGMETGMAVPFGLWANEHNGTTAFEISSFLAANKFNSVRLPICIQSLVNNVKPNKNMVNTAANQAIDVSSYMSLLQSIIKTLAFRRISVLISLHTLTSRDSGGAWFSSEISASTYLSAVDILTKNLCSNKYWNVIGLDVKNEPYQSTWGDGGAKDFQKGATEIGDRMLSGCPQWLAFVEGIVHLNQAVTIDGTDMTYNDWWGGGLQDAGKKPVTLSTDDKVVYAPHYYTPAVYPQSYLYGTGGTAGPGGTIANYVELSDSDLSARIAGTMESMFGYLAKTHDSAIVLGEFGGLYSTDLHPKLTTKRCTDFTIKEILKPGYSGGYVWSLNPESAYQFNPASNTGNYVEGVLKIDWINVNSPYLNGLKAMNSLPDLKAWPCFSI
ncbi:cell 5A endo-1,4-betaglucanase [Thraustotheca clavata]|uniref:Cell 5A endo-1,4-betaglucanase n=1 Tax=Thraustotheca clavata TaxID=74557 RepID=A0A1V9YXV6_9STRA|nr:cell 5A endo-1,4-betaglucanase [Thraustotheca clavata]